MSGSWRRTVSGLAAGLVLGGCAVGPDYRRPMAETPAAYKEQGDWKVGQPQDGSDRGAWWAVFKDPLLDGLERQVSISNQTLKGSEAAYRVAYALLDAARAGYYPTATVGAAAQRSGRSGVQGPPPGGMNSANQFSLNAGASWTLDVWGRIRRSVENAGDTAQATAGDLASARLSAQASLAQAYYQLRSADELKRLLAATVVAYTRALDITKNQHAVGVVSRADVAQAEAQLEGVRAELVNVEIGRAQDEHAIAVLIGKPPASFTLVSEAALADAPVIPLSVPSTLLERRPDIAAAERRMAAANAEIGVAIAAYYPSLTLSASFETMSSTIGTLLRSANGLWSFGPQLAETVFDGGLRDAQVAQARASFDQSIASYRQTVLTAFQQVEDQLIALRVLAEQAAVQERAVNAAADAEQLILNQYKAGTVAYTSVVTAQTVALGDRQSALTIKQQRLIAAVMLIEALGGGWDPAELNVPPAPPAAPAPVPAPAAPAVPAATAQPGAAHR
jgi:NodT family efflux transporter outer membrane factor (OMF) lipoprotein